MKLLTQVLNQKVPQARTPLWVMRQAGRYLPEYRNTRKEFKSFIEFCLTPEAAAQVTLQPLYRFDFDAAIVFSDILIVPHAMGVSVTFVEGQGPKLKPIRTNEDFAGLHAPDMEVFAKTASTIKKARAVMDKDFPGTALIGFAGAPWTVATYMIEGSGSKTFPEVSKLLYSNPMLFDKIIDSVTEATIDYLKIQVEAGAEVIKLFDSWSGLVPEHLFHKYIILPAQKIITSLKAVYPELPVIGFPRNAGARYVQFAHESKVDAVAIDQNLPLEFAIKNFPKLVIQGNFDNMLLAYGGVEQIGNEARRILDSVKEIPHIFNLGHGILPETPIENLLALIKAVRTHESRKHSS